VADEIVRLLSGATVRDRATGLARAARPADIAILFRSRDSHREYEAALDRRGADLRVQGLGFFDADRFRSHRSLRYLADLFRPSCRHVSALLSADFDAAVARLAPAVAAAIIGEPSCLAPFTGSSAREPLGDEDRQVLERLRAAVPRWLSWVDRMSPSELVDAVLRETAYAYELRGARRLQARENLKKLGGLIRRAQNRGYATLARIADHLEQLSVGDESNAAIDAVDAVSLMTVHAAKGLEFPIVFIVNMGRGTGGARAPIRVATDASGEPSVAIADYQSEADEDAQARDREESKRLLYVALTRARDRVYLSATVLNGACRMGRGSLGEVLPASLKTLFGEAAGVAGDAGERVVTWHGAEGNAHRFVVPLAPDSPRQLVADSPSAPPPTISAAVVDAGATVRVPVTWTVRLTGSRPCLRHRVSRAIRLSPAWPSGRPLYEVPFSLRVDPTTIVRGSIDCLIRLDDGRVVVVELKTGAERPEHEAQLAIYGRCASDIPGPSGRGFAGVCAVMLEREDREAPVIYTIGHSTRSLDEFIGVS
jgi:ATP-dependent exoDNAse (exonuclease V) beta subunit